MKKLVIFNLVLFFIMISCTTKDGTIPGLVDKGTVNISIQNANDQAKIFVDYRNSRKLTPDIISLLPGKHVFHVYLPGYSSQPDSHIVFVEEKRLTEIVFDMSPVQSGPLVINSQPDNAAVILDNIHYGFTPVTLDGIPVGDHTLELIKSGYLTVNQNINIQNNQVFNVDHEMVRNKRVLVLEHFSNTNCDPCVEIDERMEEILAEIDSIEIVSIAYHPNFPSPNDPIYLAAQAENDLRTDQYNVGFTPSIFLDGSLLLAFTPNLLETNLRQGIDVRSNLADQYAIMDVIVEESIDNFNGIIKLEAIEDFPADSKIKIALIEKYTHLLSPGTNGVQDYTNVMRKMYPDAGGSTISLSAGETTTIHFEFEIRSDWINQVQVVAFIQIGDSGEIIQAVQSLIY